MGKYDLIFFFPAVLLSFRGSGATARIFFTVILSVAKYPTEERTAFMGFFTFVQNDKGDSYGTAMPRLRMTETAEQNDRNGGTEDRTAPLCHSEGARRPKESHGALHGLRTGDSFASLRMTGTAGQNDRNGSPLSFRGSTATEGISGGKPP